MTAQSRSPLHPPLISLPDILQGIHSQADWRTINVQPSWPEGIDPSQLADDDQWLLAKAQRGRKPVCPHYQLIELAASLAGINPEDLAKDPHFCGQWLRYEGGGWGRKRYTAAAAKAACRTLLEALESTLERVEKKPSRKGQAQAGRERRNVIKRWRQVVFELTCLPDGPRGERRDPHFRRLQAEDLSEGEAIDKVRAICEALERQIVGDPPKIAGTAAAEHCSVAPTADLRPGVSEYVG